MGERRERPILFSSPMVQAILAGRKSMTRRALVPQPTTEEDGRIWWQFSKYSAAAHIEPGMLSDEWLKHCPHGCVGDVLWVKETWRPKTAHGCTDTCDCADVWVDYAAGGEGKFVDERTVNMWRNDWTFPKAAKQGNVSPLFMPRWASRIILEIVGLRCERLQDITEDDAIDEGVGPNLGLGEYRAAFKRLWAELNAKRGFGWSTNPWVWVIQFKRLQP